MKLSIVVTVYNEEDNILPLIQNVREAITNQSRTLFLGCSDQKNGGITDAQT